MKRLMLAHALESVAGCRFVVGEGNIRSSRRSACALERIGAKLTDRCEEQVMAGGAVILHLDHAITRADFACWPLPGPR